MANVKRPPMIHGGKKNYDSFQSHQENDYEITRMIYLLFEIKSRGSVVISGSQDSSESSVAGCQSNIDIQVVNSKQGENFACSNFVQKVVVSSIFEIYQHDQ